MATPAAAAASPLLHLLLLLLSLSRAAAAEVPVSAIIITFVVFRYHQNRTTQWLSGYLEGGGMAFVFWVLGKPGQRSLDVATSFLLQVIRMQAQDDIQGWQDVSRALS